MAVLQSKALSWMLVVGCLLVLSAAIPVPEEQHPAILAAKAQSGTEAKPEESSVTPASPQKQGEKKSKRSSEQETAAKEETATPKVPAALSKPWVESETANKKVKRSSEPIVPTAGETLKVPAQVNTPYPAPPTPAEPTQAAKKERRSPVDEVSAKQQNTAPAALAKDKATTSAPAKNQQDKKVKRSAAEESSVKDASPASAAAKEQLTKPAAPQQTQQDKKQKRSPAEESSAKEAPAAAKGEVKTSPQDKKQRRSADGTSATAIASATAYGSQNQPGQGPENNGNNGQPGQGNNGNSGQPGQGNNGNNGPSGRGQGNNGNNPQG